MMMMVIMNTRYEILREFIDFEIHRMETQIKECDAGEK